MWTSVFAWKTPWPEETGGLPSVRLQSRTRLSDWVHTSTIWTTRAKDRAYGFTCIILFNSYDDPVVTSSFINRVLFLVVGGGVWAHHLACRILVLRPRIESEAHTVEEQSLNHWTTREVSLPLLFIYLFIYVFDALSFHNKHHLLRYIVP